MQKEFLNITFETSVGVAKQLAESDLPEVVFSGKSNVGKSSLINKLLNRKAIAKVSSTPGKTSTINFFKALNFRIVDLPGYGYAKVSKAEKLRWQELIDGYFSSGRDIRLIVQLLDMRHPPTQNDIQMLEFLDNSGYGFMIALTKSDKLNKSEFEKRLTSLETELDFIKSDVTAVPFSAVTGDGADKIRELILFSISDNN